MRGGLFFRGSREKEAEVAVDPGVFVVDDGVYGEGAGVATATPRHFFDGGADGHEFDEVRHRFRRYRFLTPTTFFGPSAGSASFFQTGDGRFSRAIVNQSGEFGDFTFAEGF